MGSYTALVLVSTGPTPIIIHLCVTSDTQMKAVSQPETTGQTLMANKMNLDARIKMK